jgi:hypothetical protein
MPSDLLRAATWRSLQAEEEHIIAGFDNFTNPRVTEIEE